MKSLLSFRHPHVVPNLYTFLCSAEHKGRYFEEHILTTQAHSPNTRPCACTQNMGLSWSCLKTRER